MAATVVFEVPQDWRRATAADEAAESSEEAARIDWAAEGPATQPPLFAYHALSELFPAAPGLAEAFNGDAGFRHALREAAREDLFVSLPRLSAEQNAALKALDSSLQASLLEDKGNGRHGLRPLPRISGLFRERGLGLSAEAFVTRFLRLCGATCTGDWMDIVGSTNQRRHGWHQDTRRGGYTVMLGFPPSTGFTGEGVFSHAARISHRLRLDRGVPVVVDWDIPEAAVFRPVYAPGQEVIVYSDGALVHSAPDFHNRESVWRLM